jgi:hypothetical protein
MIWHKIKRMISLRVTLPYPVTSHSQESHILYGEKLKQRATLTSLPLSQRAPQNERALPPLAKIFAENSAPSSYI